MFRIRRLVRYLGRRELLGQASRRTSHDYERPGKLIELCVIERLRIAPPISCKSRRSAAARGNKRTTILHRGTRCERLGAGGLPGFCSVVGMNSDRLMQASRVWAVLFPRARRELQ